MHELEFLDFSKIGPLFGKHRQYIPVRAIIEGNFPGRVFVDRPTNPRLALVWALSRWAYIEGDPDTVGFQESLIELLNETIIPDSTGIDQNWFELYVPNSSSWMIRVAAAMSQFGVAKHFESVYRWDRKKYERFRRAYSYPEGVKTVTVDIPILRDSVPPTPSIPKHFHFKSAVGCRVTVGDRGVAQCRSNGFAAGSEFMIDVETFDQNDRSKGYSSAAGVALLDHCRDNGLIPVWETTEHNLASQRLAEKLGFISDQSYPVFAVEF
jgi:hypothetical protein